MWFVSSFEFKSWKQFRIEGSLAKAVELITNWQWIEAEKTTLDWSVLYVSSLIIKGQNANMINCLNFLDVRYYFKVRRANDYQQQRF